MLRLMHLKGFTVSVLSRSMKRSVSIRARMRKEITVLCMCVRENTFAELPRTWLHSPVANN